MSLTGTQRLQFIYLACHTCNHICRSCMYLRVYMCVCIVCRKCYGIPYGKKESLSHSVRSNSATSWTSPPGSSVHGILLARMLEWVAIPFSRGSSRPRDRTQVSSVSCLASGFFTVWATREALYSIILYSICCIYDTQCIIHIYGVIQHILYTVYGELYKLWYTNCPFVQCILYTLCCCLVAKSHLALCNPVDYNMPGFPVLHYPPESAQVRVHWVSDAI